MPTVTRFLRFLLYLTVAFAVAVVLLAYYVRPATRPFTEPIDAKVLDDAAPLDAGAAPVLSDSGSANGAGATDGGAPDDAKGISAP